MLQEEYFKMFQVKKINGGVYTGLVLLKRWNLGPGASVEGGARTGLKHGVCLTVCSGGLGALDSLQAVLNLSCIPQVKQSDGYSQERLNRSCSKFSFRLYLWGCVKGNIENRRISGIFYFKWSNPWTSPPGISSKCQNSGLCISFFYCYCNKLPQT